MSEAPREVSSVKLRGSWETALNPSKTSSLVKAIADYLPGRRWFRDKTRSIQRMGIEDSLLLARNVYLLIFQIEFTSGELSRYCLPVSFVPGNEEPAEAIVQLRSGSSSGYLVDASSDPAVADALLKLTARGKRLRGKKLEIRGCGTPSLKAAAKLGLASGRPLQAEQTNSSYLYGSEYVMKLFRLVESEESLELEVLRQLEGSSKFSQFPRTQGHIELMAEDGSVSTLAVVQSFVENQGDAWSLAVHDVTRFYEDALTLDMPPPTQRGKSLFDLAKEDPQPELAGALGTFLAQAQLLGQRTAEMHLALADSTDSDFEPDTFGALSKRAYYQSLRSLLARAFDGLKGSVSSFPEADKVLASELLCHKDVLRERMATVRDGELRGARIRVHGDFHLGQVLHTGKDFVILDFEGEPARSKSHRRGRRSPIADVAGMLRSFHYAAHAGMQDEGVGVIREADRALLAGWAEVWQTWIGARFLAGYLSEIEDSGLLPEAQEDREQLLDTYVMEKALYELVYELENRPTWVSTPLRGLLRIVGAES